LIEVNEVHLSQQEPQQKPTLPFRQSVEQKEPTEHDSNLLGTRAKSTERLVYRILQTREYRTLKIVTRSLEAALHTADRDTLPARAKNILDRIEKYGESGIPKNEMDLVSWSDLAVTGIKVKEGRRKARHFKPCKQCGARFLAKRSDQEFDSAKCRVRWNRSHPAVTGNCLGRPEVNENRADNEAVFGFTPGFSSKAPNGQTCLK
jgi:hypothetical protein